MDMNKKTERKNPIVLIVEDNTANYEIANSFLSDMDIYSENARDGLEALEMYETRGAGFYSAVLMDINLPRLDGIQAAARLRQLGAGIPIIAVTAYSGDSHVMSSAYDVFDSVIFKPFNYSKFCRVISSYIPAGAPLPPLQYCDKRCSPSDSSINVNVCDVRQGITNMGGNEELFVKHFNNFKRNNVDLASRLRNYVASSHYSEAATLCHSAKGVTGMLALTGIYDNIQQLEAVLQGKTSLTADEKDRTETLLNYLSDSVRQVCRIQFC